MRNNSGFSLMELMIVIALLAIMTAIGVPSYFSYLPEYRLKGAVRDLYSNMQLAKLAAVKSNGTCTISFASSPVDQYTVGPPVNKTVRLADYGSGVKFKGPSNQTFSVTTITFNSRGLSNAGYAYLTNGKETSFQRVGSLSSGVIKMQTSVGASWE